MAPGYAADDGAALHFVGSGLSRVVVLAAGARAPTGSTGSTASRSRPRWRWSTWGPPVSLVA